MDNFSEIKKQMQKSEENLTSFACLSSDAIREKSEKEDIRLEFERDVDKIIHSSTYTRYIDKTQVYSDIENDNISRRITHVQFVSRAARTIARALGVNEDLCEAISLGHDVGHTPYGHAGERILNKISKEKIGKTFAHNLNSVRMFTKIENGGNGCNLTLQVLDGIMCHNGEMLQNKYAPVKKDLTTFKKEYEACLDDEKNNYELIPMTIEGCIVRISDVIGYIGKDIEDAMRLKVIAERDIPEDIKRVLGTKNSEIMNSIILDIIENSFNKPYISMSDTVYRAIDKLKDFNMKNIYMKANTKEDVERYTRTLNNSKKSNNIYETFLNNKNKEYVLNNKKEQIIVDYLSGMTDRFIESEYERYVK